MSMTLWDPLREPHGRRFGEGPSGRASRAARVGLGLPIDVCEADDEYLLQAAIPGVRPQDLEVTVKEDTVTIRGELRPPEWPSGQGKQTGQPQSQAGGHRRPSGQRQPSRPAERQGAHCWLREIPSGRFSRSITLPTGVDSEGARAELADGLLTIHLPKVERARPKRIEVSVGARGEPARRVGPPPT